MVTKIIKSLIYTEMFGKQEMRKQAHTSDANTRTNKIPHVPARMSHSSVSVTDTDRRLRVIQN